MTSVFVRLCQRGNFFLKLFLNNNLTLYATLGNIDAFVPAPPSTCSLDSDFHLSKPVFYMRLPYKDLYACWTSKYKII